MEAQTAAPPPSDPLSAAADYPRWVMLEKDLKIQAEGSSCSTSGACETQAAARTSTGHLIQVSLRLAEPPGLSCVRLQIPDVVDVKYSMVVAAHGDSVLIEVWVDEKSDNTIGLFPQTTTIDHFVYNAGAVAANPPRPPSLSLLPLLDSDSNGTGILRRGEDELIVAQLAAVPATPDTPELMREAELSLFRNGEWSVKSLQIMLREETDAWAWDHLSRRSWTAVFPVGDRRLCWVDLERLIVVLCDVLEETPRLLFLRLPRARDNMEWPPSNRNVCATAGGDALKFVNIFPRCCCGEAGVACCKSSRHAYTIHTWTMRIDGGDDDDMEWVMDGVTDATELWALDGYRGLPCLPLDHPVLSMDEPDLICFWLHKHSIDKCYWHYTSRPVNLLMVNMRTKTIHSVSRHEGALLLRSDGPIPSKVSDFFNSHRSSGGSDGALTGQMTKSIERPPPAFVDGDDQLERIKRRRGSITSNPTLQPASFPEPCVQSSEAFFEAFQEIPSFGLDHDDMIKAYRILSLDKCRLFRSFVRLPKNARKDWLLMEIKASED